jgi:hypothetical protein
VRDASPNLEGDANLAGDGFPVTTTAATFVASNDEAWAVGDARAADAENYEPLAEEWMGTSWKIVRTAKLASEEGFLKGVSGTGPEDVWAVGEGRSSSGTVPVAEHWNGSDWSDVAIAGAEGSLHAVSADSASDAWAVGETVANSDGTITREPLIEHWNGSEWGTVASAAGSGNELVAVDALSPSDVWALGVARPSRGYSGDRTGVIEHWNGSGWSIALQLPTGTVLSSIDGVSADDVWAVGASVDDQLIEHWNGSEWSALESPPALAGDHEDLSGVSALSANDVWAVGTGNRPVSEDGIEDASTELFELTEQWNGSSWTVVPSESGSGATSVSGIAGGPLFAAGESENLSLILQQPAP